MLSAALLAIQDCFSAPFRQVLLKSLGLTLLFLALLWAAGTRLAAWFGAKLAAAYPVDYPWWADALTTVAGLLSGALLFVGLAFLLAPISALVAGFFVDDIAATVEREHYPSDPPGVPAPFWPSLGESLGFAGWALLVNLLALILLLVPGVNLVAFFVGNGFLLGREYFHLAARRLLGPEGALALRERYGFQAFLGGLAVAGLLAVPFVNLLTPLFATALMVHLVKRLTARRI
jgi:CysZ protein